MKIKLKIIRINKNTYEIYKRKCLKWHLTETKESFKEVIKYIIHNKQPKQQIFITMKGVTHEDMCLFIKSFSPSMQYFNAKKNKSS